MMKLKRPTVFIEGMEFMVDVRREKIYEMDNPENVIRFDQLAPKREEGGYFFYLDPWTNNVVEEKKITDLSYIDDFPRIEIPEFTSIDPWGMAEKYNLTVEEVKGKLDFELSIKPGSMLDLRWNKGVLPTLDIAGHTFYVDIQMEKLRPKDDFMSKGIDLKELENYYSRVNKVYHIPYQPTTHEFKPNDLSKLTELPEGIMIAQFPHQSKLDLVGWNKKNGLNPAYEVLMQKMHHVASILTWKEYKAIDKLNHVDSRESIRGERKHSSKSGQKSSEEKKSEEKETKNTKSGRFPKGYF